MTAEALVVIVIEGVRVLEEGGRVVVKVVV